MTLVWRVALHDLRQWARSPATVAAGLLPALGMGVLVAVLTASVGQQPVALVVEGQGPLATRMAELIVGDTEAYILQAMDRPAADRALREQRVAAAVVIPPAFDRLVAAHRAKVDVYLNNVNIDIADDIRRTTTRSVAEFDAPQLGIQGELYGPSTGLLLPSAYRIAVAEHDLRVTNVSFLEYQVIPILVLVIVAVGMLGTASLAARDFEGRTIKLLLLSPAARPALVAGRILGGVLVTAAAVTPLILLGVLVRALRPPAAHWPALAALLLAVTVMAVGLGLLLGTAIRQGRLVTMAGLNLATYLFFLGGGFTTIPFLPDWVQAVSRLVPTSYAIEGLRQALYYPDLIGFWEDLAAVSLVAAVAALLGVLTLRRGWSRA